MAPPVLAEEEEASAWLAARLGPAQLGDVRRTRRLLTIAQAMMAQPTASLPEACGDWAATKAAYRFFDGDRSPVSTIADQIVAAHGAATKASLAGRRVVLAVQDTTVLDYRDHPATTGLGATSTGGHGHGLWLHSTLAVSTEGVPLGVLSHTTWVRDPETAGVRSQRRSRSFGDKESHRWVAALEESGRGLPEDVTLVHVCDREADIYELLFAGQQQPQLAVLIRAAWNRRVVGEAQHLHAAGNALPIADRRVLQVPRSDDHPPREATVTLRFGQVTLRPPRHRSAEQLPDLTVGLIVVEEPQPPDGITPLRWLLLTTLPCTTVPAAWERITWYTYRWRIERYHLVLKSGCRIETRQLATAERLICCLAVSAAVAVRLLHLTYLARRTPTADATPLLGAEATAIAWAAVHPAQPMPVPFTLEAAVQVLARLGGFLGRRSDGAPGVITLWRGLQRLDDLQEGYRLAHTLASANVGNE